MIKGINARGSLKKIKWEKIKKIGEKNITTNILQLCF